MINKTTKPNNSNKEKVNNHKTQKNIKEEYNKKILYKQLPFHFKVPHGIFLYEICSIAFDSKDRVFCLSRGNVPVVVFSKEGDYLFSWGNKTPFDGYTHHMLEYSEEEIIWKGNDFIGLHGITIDHEDNVWLVDRNGNSIIKCTPEGERLMIIISDKKNGTKTITDKKKMNSLRGKKFTPSPRYSNKPFCLPCKIMISKRKNGNMFVTDGYGNCSIHKLEKGTGKYISSWGLCGTLESEFSLPHDLCLNYGENESGENDQIIISDRENHRIQIFDLNGNFIKQWRVHRPCGLAIHSFGKNIPKALYVTQLPTAVSKLLYGGPQHKESWTPNLGNCISIHDIESGKELYRTGTPTPTEGPEGFMYPHGIAVNSDGDIYTGNVAFHIVGIKQQPLPYNLVTLRKLKSLHK